MKNLVIAFVIACPSLAFAHGTLTSMVGDSMKNALALYEKEVGDEYVDGLFGTATAWFDTGTTGVRVEVTSKKNDKVRYLCKHKHVNGAMTMVCSKQ